MNTQKKSITDWYESESYVEMVGESAVNDCIDALRGGQYDLAKELIEESIDAAWRRYMDQQEKLESAAVDPHDPYRLIKTWELARE